jgi:hypothetical protein
MFKTCYLTLPDNMKNPGIRYTSKHKKSPKKMFVCPENFWIVCVSLVWRSGGSIDIFAFDILFFLVVVVPGKNNRIWHILQIFQYMQSMKAAAASLYLEIGGTEF